jgi:hypothetical protein
MGYTVKAICNQGGGEGILLYGYGWSNAESTGDATVEDSI